MHSKRERSVYAVREGAVKIIISPAKKMNMDTDTFEVQSLPPYLEDTGKLMEYIRSLSFSEAQELWRCNDKIAGLNYRRFQDMDLRKNLTPALISYEGIQYQYMAPEVFTQKEWEYVQKHLRILSGFYGILSPLDGVTPYRLEMQAKAQVSGTKNLYDFWGDKLYQKAADEERVVINLASREYSRCIERYLCEEDTYVTCVFGEYKQGRVIQKGTQAKMARGEMVRYMAGQGILTPDGLKNFVGLGYHYEEELSSENEYVYIKW